MHGSWWALESSFASSGSGLPGDVWRGSGRHSSRGSRLASRGACIHVRTSRRGRYRRAGLRRTVTLHDFNAVKLQLLSFLKGENLSFAESVNLYLKALSFKHSVIF